MVKNRTFSSKYFLGYWIFFLLIQWSLASCASVHSFAEQFTSQPLEAQSTMRSDTEGSEKPSKIEETEEKEAQRELNQESFMLKNISIKGNTIYTEEDLKFLYETELHNLTTLHTLKQIAKKISNFYRKNGYILCRAVLPEQDVLDGDVTFVVKEQGIKAVEFEGDVDLISSVRSSIEEAMKKSVPFHMKDLQTQLNLIRTGFPVLVYPEMRPLQKGSLDVKVTFVIKELPRVGNNVLQNAGPTFFLRRINLQGNDSIPTHELEALFQHDLGKPLTEAKLQEIVKRISNFYRAQGYILSRAYLPKQEVTQESITIKIKEGTLGTVALEGDTKGLKPEKVKAIQEAIHTDKPFHLKDLTHYMSLVQTLGHFHIYPSLKPLDGEFKADLVFFLQAMKPEEIREEDDDKLRLPTKFKLNKINFAGNTAFSSERLLELVEDKMGKMIELSEVKEITQAITRFYRQEGYILSQAILPPQDVENGALQVKVIEGYISEVIFEGDMQDLEEFLAYTADRIKKSRPLHLKDLEGQLLLLKDLPHLSVTSTMRPGRHVKYSSTLVVTLRKRYWEGSVSGNNYGTDNVGPLQASGMLTVTSPFHATHKINISGSKSYSPKELKLIQTGYTIPVGFSGAKLTADAMISRSNPATSSFNSNLQIYGTEDRVGLSTSIPLIRGRYHNLFTNFSFVARTVESKSSIGLTNTKDRIRKVSWGLVLDFSDFLKGVNILRVEGVKGLPNLGATKNDSSKKSRPKGNPHFSLVEFFASRDQHLFEPFSLYAMIHGQVGCNPLLSSERFRGGGMPYNKAYANSVTTGDSGIEWKTELRFMRSAEHYLQNYMLYAYFSEIRVWNRSIQVGEKKFERARGIGLGARATFQSGPTLEFEYGRPITSLVSNQHHKSKILLGFTYSMNNV